MALEYKSALHNEESRLVTVKKCKQYQNDRLEEVMGRVSDGEPYGICNVDEMEEIFHAFGMPVIPLQYWSSVISSKRLSVRYFDYMAKKGYDQDPYYSLGLGCSMAHDPDAPYGGLPRPAVVVGNAGYDSHQAIKELWARELGAPYFPINAIEAGMGAPPKWWDNIYDDWDKKIDPEILDLRVAEMKEFIHFVEVSTGKSFDPDKLAHTLDVLNEHMTYMAKIRDIIATVRPLPVSLRDQLAMYPLTWWRGIESARDLAKEYYEDLLQRLEDGTCVYKDEKIRLFWTSQGLWQNTKFYHAFEKKYDTVFAASMYQSIIADGYARNPKGDPLRCIAGRQYVFGVASEEWLLKECIAHGCYGAVGQAPAQPLFEAAGIPYLCIGGSNVDARGWDEEKIEAQVGQFIEERVIPSMKKKGINI